MAAEALLQQFLNPDLGCSQYLTESDCLVMTSPYDPTKQACAWTVTNLIPCDEGRRPTPTRVHAALDDRHHPRHDPHRAVRRRERVGLPEHLQRQVRAAPQPEGARGRGRAAALDVGGHCARYEHAPSGDAEADERPTSIVERANAYFAQRYGDTQRNIDADRTLEQMRGGRHDAKTTLARLRERHRERANKRRLAQQEMENDRTRRELAAVRASNAWLRGTSADPCAPPADMLCDPTLMCADIPICADLNPADAPPPRGDSEYDDFSPYYDPTLGPPGAPADIRQIELGGTSPSRHVDSWDAEPEVVSVSLWDEGALGAARCAARAAGAAATLARASGRTARRRVGRRNRGRSAPGAESDDVGAMEAPPAPSRTRTTSHSRQGGRAGASRRPPDDRAAHRRAARRAEGGRRDRRAARRRV